MKQYPVDTTRQGRDRGKKIPGSLRLEENNHVSDVRVCRGRPAHSSDSGLCGENDGSHRFRSDGRNARIHPQDGILPSVPVIQRRIFHLSDRIRYQTGRTQQTCSERGLCCLPFRTSGQGWETRRSGPGGF